MAKKIVCINHKHHQYQYTLPACHPIKTLRHFLLIAASSFLCALSRSPVTNLKPRTEKEWQSMHRKQKTSSKNKKKDQLTKN
jgi:hypothetical protein